jgi:signal transduction histidine kinase/DNA-binding response OmpR family regulator
MSIDSDLILVVDDEQTICYVLSSFFTRVGYRTETVSSAEEALSMINDVKPAVALLDIKLPGMNGLQLLGEFKKVSPDTEVIIMTSYASTDTAIEAIRKEAYDYIPKPFEDLDEVWATVRRAFEKRFLSLKSRKLLLDLQTSNRELSAIAKRLNSLVDAGRAMGGISDLHNLLDFFVGVVSKELEVDRVSLMLVDEEAQEMWIVASRGLDESVKKGVRRKVGEGIAGWVAREGKPVLVKDVLTDPRVKAYLHSTHATSFISAPIVLSIPIQIQEKVLGVINVTDRRNGQSFDEEDMAFLYSLAGQAAVAIERTRQYDELQAAFESLKAAQKTLMETERMNALGLMAAGVAHDFNNLLTGILGRVQLLRMKIDTNGTDLPLMLSQLELIENLTLQGATTVRRIQEFARIRKDIPSDSVDINSVVRTAYEVTRGKWKDECETKGVSVEMCLDLGMIPVTRGNTHELTQVVTNLIMNAVDAMPKGGKLTLRTFLEGDTIMLEVSDTGIGMSKEVKEKLFQPFFTTKGNGSGLGTSIVYGIVARHGGEIKVSSDEGEGTTFLLTLPFIDIPPEDLPDGKKEERKWKKKESGAPAKILLVEDNDLNRELFRGYIMDMGHHAVAASCGKDALSILEKGEVDLVVTDLSMPGITGYQVAQEAKKRNPVIPVILVTGWAVQQDESKLRESGVDFLLKKPCRLLDFQEMVQKALSLRKEKQGTPGNQVQGTSPTIS